MTVTLATVLAICAGIVTISNCATAVLNWKNRLKEPSTVQDNRISKLEEKVAELEKGRKLNEDGIRKLEEDTKVFQKIMVKSLQALSEHALGESPDTKARLKDSVNDLNNYLIDK